jgi:hypothetical protein
MWTDTRKRGGLAKVILQQGENKHHSLNSFIKFEINKQNRS